MPRTPDLVFRRYLRLLQVRPQVFQSQRVQIPIPIEVGPDQGRVSSGQRHLPRRCGRQEHAVGTARDRQVGVDVYLPISVQVQQFQGFARYAGAESKDWSQDLQLERCAGGVFTVGDTQRDEG